jgi:FemAB-related protein (PEP-CTERM system-associated)
MVAATSLPTPYVDDARSDARPRLAPYVEELPASESGAWDAYALRQPGATLYHLHAWRPIARRAYGLDAPFLVARDAPGGSLRGVLPLFRVPRPFAPYLTNGLFGAYGDVLADDARYARALLHAAAARVDRGQADYLHLKLLSDPPSSGLARKDVWVTARLALGANEDSTWASLATAMRTKIRHARNAGLVPARDGDVGGFYDVLSENMLRKGAPIYGRAFFDALVAELGPRANVVTLRQDGSVVSAALVAWVNDVMYVPFASSRPAVFSLKANQLLWWEIARYAHALGLRTLDFGSSMRDSSGLEFKKHWRTRVEPIGSYLYARAGVHPVLVPAESAVARFTVNAWSRLPARWAETLGPRVARWIA